MELLNGTFSAQSVALATGCTAKQITDWCNLGRIIGQREPLGRGNSRKFTWFNVMEIAIAAELMETGFSSVADAFSAAQRFAHTGTSAAQWMGDDATAPIRVPGLPWHHKYGRTVLFVWKHGSSVRLIGDDGKVTLSRIAPQSHHAASFIVVDVSEVFLRVCSRMALHPYEVLDEAYPEAARD